MWRSLPAIPVPRSACERYLVGLMEEKAIRGVPWTMLSYSSTKAVTVLTMLVMAHLLPPEDFGLMAFAQITISFLNWFAGLSFSGTLIVRQELDARGRGTILTITLMTATASALLAIALSPLLAELFRQPRVKEVIPGFALVLVVGGIANFYESVLQRNMQFRRRFIALGAQAFTTASVSITLAVLGLGVWSLVIGQLASNGVYALLLFLFAAERITPRFQRSVVASVFRTGRGFLAQGVTEFVRGNIDSVMVGRLLGTTSLGYYSMASKLGDQTYWAIADPVAHVTFPAFARSRARGEDFRPSFLSVLRLVAIVGCFAGLVLTGAAEPFTRAVFGHKWLPMIGPLWILGVWAAIRPVSTTLGWVLNSVERAGVVGWISLAVLVPLVPGFVLAAHIGTMSAFACVVLADAILSLLILSGLVCRYIDLRVRDLWQALRPVVFASPPSWLAMFVAGRLIVGLPQIVVLLISVGAGATVYVGVMALVEPGIVKRVLDQVRRMLGLTPVPADVLVGEGDAYREQAIADRG